MICSNQVNIVINNVGSVLLLLGGIFVYLQPEKPSTSKFFLSAIFFFIAITLLPILQEQISRVIEGQQLIPGIYDPIRTPLRLQTMRKWFLAFCYHFYSRWSLFFISGCFSFIE